MTIIGITVLSAFSMIMYYFWCEVIPDFYHKISDRLFDYAIKRRAKNRFKNLIVGTSPWLENVKERKRIMDLEQELLNDKVDNGSTKNNNT